MLVLSRKIGESVVVGDNARIVVLDVRGAKVQLGVEAPRDVAVFRGEIVDRNRVGDKSESEDDGVVSLDFSRDDVVLKRKSSSRSNRADRANREADKARRESEEASR